MNIIDFLFPKICVGCGKSGDYLCNSCFSQIQKLNDFCPYCRQYSYKGKTHKSCEMRLGLDGVKVCWKYAGNMRKLLLKLKYNFSYDIAEFLADKLNSELQTNSEFYKRAVFVPVPLHKGRERWRGFNQEEEVCRKLCELNNWRMEELLIRKKPTKTQARLKGQERKENVKDVFEINPRIDSATSNVLRTASSSARFLKIASFDTLDYERVIIFDDVWTSGSTIKECCKVLKKAGVKQVWGMTIAG